MIRKMSERLLREDAQEFTLRLNDDYSASDVLEMLVIFCGGPLILPAPLKQRYDLGGTRYAALTRELPGFDWIFPDDVQIERTGEGEYTVRAIPIYFSGRPNRFSIDRLSRMCRNYEEQQLRRYRERYFGKVI